MARQHLVKTFDGFTVLQPVTGVYFWRTPTGYWCRVDHTGTQPLGKHEPAVLQGRAYGLDKTNLTSVEALLRERILQHQTG